MMTRTMAEEAANIHRGRYGDDVVLHDPDDHGDFFGCEDCGWTLVYVDPDDLAFEDEDESGLTEAG